MALITNTGVSPDGTTHPIPIAGIGNSSTTPLAANGVWDSGILLYNGNESAHFSIQADQAGSYSIEYYKNGSKINFTGNSTPYDPAIVTAFQGALSGKGDGFKLIYTNGSVAQTQFYVEIRFADVTQETLRSIGTPMSSTNLGSSTHAVIEGRENGTGIYKQGTVTTSGSKIGQDVNVLNPGGVTDVSTLAKAATQTDGTQKTQVTNFPATQPISASALPLPTGAATSAKQDQIIQRPSTGVTTAVNTTATSSVILAANTNRKGATVFSVTGTILINLGATSSATLFTARIITNGYYEIPFGYTGVISAIGAGTVAITELT